MSEPVINEDELVEYIMEKAGYKLMLTSKEVRAVLDAEMEYLKEKGIAEADTAER